VLLLARSRHRVYAPRAVSSKRAVSPALALLLALSVQAAHGAALRSVAEIRAARCCSDVCHRIPSKGAARRCCQVGQDDPGTVTASKELRAPVLAVACVAPRSAEVGAPTGTPVPTETVARGRAAPLFLLTQSFRL
jgi:hypothetical protein